jgi:hypothetical protein
MAKMERHKVFGVNILYLNYPFVIYLIFTIILQTNLFITDEI